MCRIVCKSAWGKLTPRTAVSGEDGGGQTEAQWHLVHDQLTFTKPESPSMLANMPEGDVCEGVITYQDYLDDLYPKGDDGTWTDEIKEVRSKL